MATALQLAANARNAQSSTGPRSASGKKRSRANALQHGLTLPNSDPDAWTDKVSFESFSDPPLPDPILLLKSIADDQRKTCEKFSDHDTFSGVENDYPTSVRLYVCSVNPLTKKGQLTLVKTIRGDAHFYVFTRARRVPPIDGDAKKPVPEVAKAVAEWSMYLRAISVCNDTDPRHPCPTAPAATNAEATEATAPAKSE